MTTPPVRIVVADDQGVIRAGLRLILDNEADMVVVGEAADGAEALAVVSRTRPDVVLMDIRMPRMDGIEATRRIRASRAGAPAASSTVLVLTTFNDEEYVLGAVRAGASGFLLKDAGPDTLVKAVRTVFDGHSLIDPAVTQVLIARCLELETLTQPPSSANGQQVSQRKRRMATLTEREQEILLGLARGASNRELARRLTVSETTIKSHVSNVLTKLDLQSRVQAVVFAYETGLVVPGTTGR